MDLTNKEYAAQATLFRKACDLAGIPITPRQASKFMRRFGKAYKYYEQAKRVLLDESDKAEAEKKARFDKQVNDAVDSGLDPGKLSPEMPAKEVDNAGQK